MSWADIFVLLFSANYKAPLLKFFMKKQLQWIPLIYLVHKTIDMPFVNRHSREEITKNPNLKIIDFENSRIAAKDLQGILQQLSVLLREQDSQTVRKRQ